MSPPLYFLYSDIIDRDKMEVIMANKKASVKVQPAMLAPNESVIPKELADKYKKHLEDLKEKENNFIGSFEKKTSGSKKGSLESTGESDIIATSAKAKPSAKAGHKKPTVAIYSERNVSWIGVGKVSKGYNIVTREQADRWLTRKHVREATPEEVASQFGV
jgi:hypothetical protein